MIREFIYLILSLVLLIASAYVSFDVPLNAYSIPISLQSLAVLVVAYFFEKMGSLAILLYLLLGILGFAVFADGKSGFDVLTGPSGGYLYGFLIVSLILNILYKERTYRFGQALQFMILGTMGILLFGVVHLAIHFGWKSALDHGLIPFIPGAAIKAVIGAAIVSFGRQVISKV